MNSSNTNLTANTATMPSIIAVDTGGNTNELLPSVPQSTGVGIGEDLRSNYPASDTSNSHDIVAYWVSNIIKHRDSSDGINAGEGSAAGGGEGGGEYSQANIEDTIVVIPVEMKNNESYHANAASFSHLGALSSNPSETNLQDRMTTTDLTTSQTIIEGVATESFDTSANNGETVPSSTSPRKTFLQKLHMNRHNSVRALKTALKKAVNYVSTPDMFNASRKTSEVESTRFDSVGSEISPSAIPSTATHSSRSIILHSRTIPEDLAYKDNTDPLAFTFVKPGENDIKLPKITLRIMAMYEGLVALLQHPSIRFQTKNIEQKKKFVQIPTTFLAGDLANWIRKRCNLISNDETVKFCQNLVNFGYIIPCDLQSWTFEQDQTCWIFQTSLLWTSRGFNPTNIEYLRFLHYRSLRGKGDTQLQDYEIAQLDKLKASLTDDVWNSAVVEEVERWNQSLSNIPKPEKKLWYMRQYGFWHLYRSPPNVKPFKDRVDVDKLGPKSEAETEEMFESRLTEPKLLRRLLKKQEALETSLATNKIKVSAAAKSLIMRYEIWKEADGLLPTYYTQNPWRTEDLTLMEQARSHPTVMDVRIWCISLRDLLSDPLGVKYFSAFLRSEYSLENLTFFLEAQDLFCCTATQQELKVKIRRIYERYFTADSVYEINLDASIREMVGQKVEQIIDLITPKKPLRRQGTIAGKLGGRVGVSKTIGGAGLSPAASSNSSNPLKVTEPDDLDIYVFLEASKSIYTLMSKDSYLRFMQGDTVTRLLKGQRVNLEENLDDNNDNDSPVQPIPLADP